VQGDPFEVMAFRPHATTLRSVYAEDRLSDHSPVSITFHKPQHKPTDTTPIIPPWVFKHKYFPTAFADIHSTTTPTQCPYTNLEMIAKQALHAAASRTKEHIATQQVATTTEEKQHWTAQCWKACKSRSGKMLCKAVQAYPALQQYVSTTDCCMVDANGLLRHLSQLTVAAIDSEVADVAGLTAPEAADREQQVDKLLGLRRLWRKSGKQLRLEAIGDPRGNTHTQPAEAAQLLADHWGPVFCAPSAYLSTRSCVTSFSNFLLRPESSGS